MSEKHLIQSILGSNLSQDDQAKIINFLTTKYKPKKSRIYPLLNCQDFLSVIWEDENFNQLSEGEIEKYINSNLVLLGYKYRIRLNSQMTRAEAYYYKINSVQVTCNKPILG